MKIIRLSSLLCVLSCPALADNLPEPTLLAGVGVHFNENDGTNPAEQEHNFGTVGYDSKPKLAYFAFQTLTRKLSGFGMAPGV